MRVRLLHNMARSGGTLIARCIGSMQGVVQLSEIHPHAMNVFNPAMQAHNWYGLLTPENIKHFSADKVEFREAIEIIAARCEQQNLKLVIRDWSHLDFIGVPYTDAPAYRLMLTEALQDSFDVTETTTVRHPLDTWLSLRRMRPMQGRINPEKFLRGYLKFARYGKKLGFIKYEDLVSDPDRYFELLCHRLKLRFDPGYKDRWSRYDKVTGDPYTKSRGGEAIRSLPRRSYEPELLEIFASSKDYQAAIKLLGYKHPV